MQYQQLGKSSLQVSRVGFGCMSLQPGQQDVQQLLHAAIERGINFFDTADLYEKGLNELAVGKSLKTKRQQVILATKAGNQWRPDGSGWDWNPRKPYILSAAEKSLKRLQTDYIDLYQLHGGTIEDPIDETIAAFEQLQQEGNIRYYGISSIRPNVIREYVRRSNITSVMMQYSLLDRRPEETCLPLLQEHNIGVLARGTVAGGLLAGKPPHNYLAHSAAVVAQGAAAIKNLAGQKRTAAGLAIQFALQQPGITAAIIGIRTLQQLTEAVEATGLEPLSQNEMLNLLKAVPTLIYSDHR
ncbi:aldo/keto reductase [Flavihumibacter profundi]|uniref:aldo/keto reductase n=1 Tax=Flavihumibacter profundi TaxID=2716883 RepID=UPI0021D40881|nr:aldo/keto reductase [Flavihumibacter profundi]